MAELTSGLVKFKKAQHVLEKIFAELPLQHVMLLLAIAEQDGITQPKIAEKLGWPQGTVSRNVKKLSVYLVESDNGNKTKAGYELVAQRPDVDDRKANAVYLTAKGKKVLKEISDIIEG